MAVEFHASRATASASLGGTFWPIGTFLVLPRSQGAEPMHIVVSRVSVFVGLVIAALVAGCAGDAGTSFDSSSEQVSLESEVAVDSGESTSPFAFRAIAPCFSESDYVRSGAVFVQNGGCSPQCVRLASGGTVVFIGALPLQPVEPRAGGSAASPITRSIGGAAEFEFPDYGFFPFRCGPGPDATGVVWSTFW